MWGKGVVREYRNINPLVEGEVPEGAVPITWGHLQWSPNEVLELKRYFKSEQQYGILKKIIKKQ